MNIVIENLKLKYFPQKYPLDPMNFPTGM